MAIYCIFVYSMLLVGARRFVWPFIGNLCIPHCSFEPGVLLWPFIIYLCIPLLLEPGVSCGHLLYICVFHIARLSQAFSCGHLLHICVFHVARWSQAFCGHLLHIPHCSFVHFFPFIIYVVVFHIARLSQAFSCGHLLHICVFHVARLFSHLLHICEPGVLLWPFIIYLCIPHCAFEPGVLLWPFIIFVYSMLLVGARPCGHVARLIGSRIPHCQSQAFSCGHLLYIHIAR